MCLFVAFIASLWQMIIAFKGRKPAGLVFQTDQQRKWAFVFLFVYMLVNFAAEFISFTVAPGYPNHLNYCVNILVHSFSLFAFFALVLGTRLMLVTGMIGWGMFIFMFFFRKYYYFYAMLNSIDIAGYFVIMGVCSAIFLRQVLGRYAFQGNKFAVQLGVLCTVYFAVGSLTVSFIFLSSMKFDSGDLWVMVVTLMVNTMYYAFLAFLFIRNIIRI